MLDFWNAIGGIFNSFDGITYAMMAIIVVGAGFMMPNMTAIVTTTLTSMSIFALAVFSRSALAAPDASVLARSEWSQLLELQLRTLLVYGTVFGFAIALIHALRSVAKR